MEKKFRLISIIIALFIFLSVTPSSIQAGDDAAEKVVKDFAKAYFMLDHSMADYLSEETVINEDGVNLVNFYIENMAMEAQNQGYKLSSCKKKPPK